MISKKIIRELHGNKIKSNLNQIEPNLIKSKFEIPKQKKSNHILTN